MVGTGSPLGGETHLGPYRLGKALGTGGMGTVYFAEVDGRAHGVESGSRVAVKIVHPHLLETPGFFKRFLREGEVGKSVRHENVVRTYDCDQLMVGGVPQSYLVMEYVEGQTLRDLLVELGRVPEELCRHVGREVCKGLAAIHAAGVVHRDLKPENVLITEEQVVKVMDLGVARLTDETVKLSQTGAFVGSVHYAAPEQFGEAGVDHRADLHALGLVLYELACGQHPYYDEDFRIALKRLLHEEPRRVSEINPQISPFFEEIVHTLIAKDPKARLQTADEVVAILQQGEESAWWEERAKALRTETRQPLRRIRIVRETAIYGRDAEIAKLRTLYDDVKSGQGHVLLVEGEAGIGKTRLVDEFVGQLRQDGEDLNFLFGSYPPGGAATAAGAFSTAYREHFGEAGLHETLAEYLTVTPGLIPAFAALLLGEATPKNEEPLTKDSLQTVFLHATRALAAERPTVVLIDDLHFAPDDGRALFAALAAAITHNPVFLVGTLRPGSAEDWAAEVQRLEHSDHMPIARLGPKDLFRLLQDTLRSERLANELAGQIAVKSDGNPYFVFEIIRGLRDGSFITQADDGSWMRTGVIDQIRIPSTVMDLIQARIGELDEEEKDLLEVASCCGYEFDPGLVAAALDMKRIPALKRFGAIEKTHRLVRSSGRKMVFDHYQVQEALYEGVLEQLREEYHAALAEALEYREKVADKDPKGLNGALCLEICEHWFKGARGEEAVRYLDRALDYLEAGYLHAEAATLADRALSVPGLLDDERRFSLLLREAARLGTVGDRRRQRAALDEARALADTTGDAKKQMRVGLSLAGLLREIGRFDEARDLGAAVLEQARAADDKRLEGDVLSSLGGTAWRQGRYDEALELAERRMTLAEAMGDEAGTHAANMLRANVFQAVGRFDEARILQEHILAASDASTSRSSLLPTIGNLGNALASLGRYAESVRHLSEVLEISRKNGSRPHEGISHHNLGGMRLLMGDSEGARSHLDAALRLARETAHKYLEAATLPFSARLERLTGSVVTAERLLRESARMFEETGVRDGFSADAEFELAELLADTEREAEARVHCQAAIDMARHAGVPKAEVLGRCLLALLPGGEVAPAVEAYDSQRARLAHEDRRRACSLLWKATGDRTHLVEAKRLLDEALAHAGDEHRDSMIGNVPLHRDIWDAAQEAGL